jgi:hypothetical protein
MKLTTTCLGVFLGATSTGVAAQEVAPIGYARVDAVLAALRSDPSSKFEKQAGWTIVAASEGGRAVQWFFTPENHPAHPAVIKRTVRELNGTSYIDLAALCHVEQSECDLLLVDFDQVHELSEPTLSVEQVTLDVGIALNSHERVRVSRMVAEEGKAAEIRMDDVMKLVIVPTLDEDRGVMLWTAMYEYAGGEYVLLSPPTFATPGDGTAQIEVASDSGNTFGFSITPLVAGR